MNIYTFNRQYQIGKEGEKVLDSYYSRWFDISQSSREQERRGIDRWFNDGQRHLAIEYKTDTLADKTRNAYIETVSVSKPDKTKKGWVYTCQADILLYYVIGDEAVYTLDPKVLLKKVPHWQNIYPTRTCKNKGYEGKGILVPLKVLGNHSLVVTNLTN